MMDKDNYCEPDVKPLPEGIYINMDIDSNTCNACAEPSSAKFFCTNCQMKLCEKDLELHNAYQTKFKQEDHCIVPYADFKADPRKHMKKFCAEHKTFELSLVCSYCSALVCNQCKYSKMCKYDGQSHSWVQIHKYADELKEKISGYIGQLYDKSKAFVELERNAACVRSEAERKTKEVLEKIETETEEAIKLLRSKSGLKKKQAQERCDDYCLQTTNYIRNLSKTSTDMDELRNQLHNLMTKSSDVHIITSFSAFDERAKKEVRRKQPTVCLPAFVLADEDSKPTYQSILPEGLEMLLVKNSSSTSYYSVNWTKDDTLVCCGYGSTEIRDRGLNLLMELEESLDDVLQYNDDIIGLQDNSRAFDIKVFSKDLHYRMDLVSDIPYQGYISHLSATNNTLAVIDSKNKILRLYGLTGNHVLDINLEKFQIRNPQSVCLTDDGHALITDFSDDGSLVKITVKANSELIWKCRSLRKPIGICSEGGLLYVASQDAKVVYVISSSGDLLKQLTHEELSKTEFIDGITIKHGKLALACGSQGIKLFKMTYAEDNEYEVITDYL